MREWLTHSTAADSPVFYTNKGLAKAHPDGTLQHTANAAFYVLLAAKKGIVGNNYMLHACWARNQMGYMLGDAGRSYVTGERGVAMEMDGNGFVCRCLSACLFCNQVASWTYVAHVVAFGLVLLLLAAAAADHENGHSAKQFCPCHLLPLQVMVLSLP